MRAYFGTDAVALSDRGRVIVVERAAARDDPLRLLDDALKRAGGKISDIAEITVDRGPGGFSAVRRRVAAASSLAFALGAPLAAVEGISPEAAAALPSGAFQPGAAIEPLYTGKPNITKSKRARLLNTD